VVSKSKRAALEAETVDPSQVEGAVADGLLIARSAASISVANRIIIRALREQKTFDRDETRQAVRDELGRLTREQRELAARMVETRAQALKSRGRSKHQFDYRVDDNSALVAREAIYSTIATRLDALAGDAAYVDEIVTASRDRAWNDIGSTIISQVNAVVVPDTEYGEHRDERLQQSLEVDLAALAASAHGDSAR
jgi:hypothetical protein